MYELAVTNGEVLDMFCNMVRRWFKKTGKDYHGFVLGLFVDLSEEYVVTSNRESGFGRYDVVIEPKDWKNGEAFILAFKVRDTADEQSLKDTVRAAHDQIEEKRYDFRQRPDYGEKLVEHGYDSIVSELLCILHKNIFGGNYGQRF